MAIEFDCPHCGHHYRLKDELAGKAAACKNCRKKIEIPKEITIPDDVPRGQSVAEVEAAAIAALSDAPETRADPSRQIVDVECNFCGTRWTEPLSRAGKNMLCPNPECRQRVKIPEPKDEGQYDWRQNRSKLPSGAKQHQEKLEGVQATEQAKQVSGKALKEAGAIEEELEPRPLKQKVMFVLVPLALIAGLAIGINWWLSSRSDGMEDRVMAEAQTEFAGSVDALPKEEVPLFTAVMHTAGAEYALRQNKKEQLHEAMDNFAKAQNALRGAAATPARNALLAELAVAMLALGGTEEQARDEVRIRWTPDFGVRARPNQRVFTVYEELQKLLGMAQTADMDFRTQFARRLTRELISHDQAALAAELIPLALFSLPERGEAEALVALEIYRADPNSPLAQSIAAAPELRTRPSSASAQSLFLALKIDKPVLVIPPGPAGSVQEAQRLAYAGAAALEGRHADALALAQRPGRSDEQLRAMALCAEWAKEQADREKVLDAALGVVNANTKKGKDSPFSAYSLIQLARIAAEAGRFDQANQFADALSDDGAKAWAKGEAVRIRLAAAPKEKGDAGWAELPDDPKTVRAGQAWGRLWLARHNTRISKNRADETKAVSAWPAFAAPFGKAGVALGLQDPDN